MHTFVLADWTTVRGASGVTITQSESEWLDLTQYEDLTFWIDVKEVTPTGAGVTLAIQTSPTKDDSLFATISSNTNLAAGIINPSAGANKGICLMASASIPVARYVRWQLTGPASTYDATFRIFISANAPGA
jgi:hypothetical protein